MSSRLGSLRVGALRVGLVVSLVAGLGTIACTSSERERGHIDTRLETHALLDGAASPEGLAYVQAIADAHRRADLASDRAAQISILRSELERPWPAGDGTAELLHYETLARVAELTLAGGDAEQVLALLTSRLEPGVSLPIARAAARCLVALGDAAAQTGDHALAMGSYARALEMLQLLLEEVES